MMSGRYFIFHRLPRSKRCAFVKANCPTLTEKKLNTALSSIVCFKLSSINEREHLHTWLLGIRHNSPANVRSHDDPYNPWKFLDTRTRNGTEPERFVWRSRPPCKHSDKNGSINIYPEIVPRQQTSVSASHPFSWPFRSPEDINFPATPEAVRSEFVILNNRRQRKKVFCSPGNFERVSRICKLFRPVSFDATRPD